MKIAVLGTRGFPNVQGGIEAHCENLYPRREYDRDEAARRTLEIYRNVLK